MLQRQKTKIWLLVFDHGCVIEIIVFFDSFFAIFVSQAKQKIT